MKLQHEDAVFEVLGNRTVYFGAKQWRHCPWSLVIQFTSKIEAWKACFGGWFFSLRRWGGGGGGEHAWMLHATLPVDFENIDAVRGKFSIKAFLGRFVVFEVWQCGTEARACSGQQIHREKTQRSLKARLVCRIGTLAVCCGTAEHG